MIENSKTNGITKSRKQLMLEAGYSEVSATTTPAREMNSAGVRLALAEKGVTPEAISQVFKDAMSANVVTQFHGKVEESQVADHKIRLQAVSLAADVLGIKETKVKVEQINVDVDAELIRNMFRPAQNP